MDNPPTDPPLIPKFAAHLTLLFTKAPFMERIALARAAGFTHVEYLFPYAFKAEELKAELTKHGLQQVLFNLPAGDRAAGVRPNYHFTCNRSLGRCVWAPPGAHVVPNLTFQPAS